MIPHPAAASGPAIALPGLQKRAPALVSLYKAAGEGLARKSLQGTRAAVHLVLDRSGSMRPFYRDGTVQHLAEQVLSLAAHLDDDGIVPVTFFSTDVDGRADLGLDDHTGRIATLHEGLGHMGRTNYHLAMDEVITRHLEPYEDPADAPPALVVFQTDGGPTSRLAAEKYLCKAARLPLFWQFVGFGDPDQNEFRFLHRLDELAVPARRVVDNAGFFHAGAHPRGLGNAELYDALLAEFPSWLREYGTWRSATHSR